MLSSDYGLLVTYNPGSNLPKYNQDLANSPNMSVCHGHGPQDNVQLVTSGCNFAKINLAKLKLKPKQKT